MTTVMIVPTFGEKPSVLEKSAIMAENPLCNKNVPVEAKSYRYEHRDRYKNLGLRSFLISAYTYGLDWLPGWLGSVPESHYYDDPWITDPDANRRWNPFAVRAGGRFVNEFSPTNLHVSAHAAT